MSTNGRAKFTFPNRQRILSNSKNILSTSDSLLSSIFFLWIIAIISFFYNSYNNHNLLEYLIFKVDDGWCDNTVNGIGVHCFGDFGLPFSWAGNIMSPYESPGVAATNTPVTYLYFQVLRLFSYQTALVIYIVHQVAGIFFMMLHATNNVEKVQRFGFIVFGGLLSIGTISAIDRGNHVAFIAPLLYLFLISKNWRLRTFILALIISLKFWGFAFVLIPFALKRYKEAFLSIILSIIVSSLTFSYLSNELLQGAKNMFTAVTSKEIAQGVAPYSLSELGLIRRMACFLGPENLCSFSSGGNKILIISLLIPIPLVILAWISVKQHTWTLQARFFPVVILILLGLPEAGQYVLILVTTITALIVKSDSLENAGTESNFLSYAIVLAVALTTVPISFAYFDPKFEFLYRWQFFISPITLTLIFIIYILELVFNGVLKSVKS